MTIIFLFVYLYRSMEGKGWTSTSVFNGIKIRLILQRQQKDANIQMKARKISLCHYQV